jgi:hypothetical protein
MDSAKDRIICSGFWAALVLGLLFCLVAGGVATAQSSPEVGSSVQFPPVGPGNVFVTPRFGGSILGYSIDPTGTEGLLSEFLTLQDGNFFIATETFDQKTGKILKVLAKQNDTPDDYATWGVFGKHVGLDEFQQPTGNVFPVAQPLDGNKFTSTWTPPLKTGDLLWSISGDQESSEVAVLKFHIKNGGNEYATVFSSDVGANTFGRETVVKDLAFSLYVVPVIAYDSKTDEAVLSGACANCTPEVATVDLKTGKVREFKGLGNSTVNGIAVDSKTGVAVTTTVGDNGVEFYDLAKQTGFKVILPCAEELVADSGEDVEFDSLHKLFFVQQVFNSCDDFSRLYAYDEKGNVVETLTGFQILPVSPTLIALHPANRSGFMFSNRLGEALQSFTY